MTGVLQAWPLIAVGVGGLLIEPIWSWAVKRRMIRASIKDTEWRP